METQCLRHLLHKMDTDHCRTSLSRIVWGSEIETKPVALSRFNTGIYLEGLDQAMYKDQHQRLTWASTLSVILCRANRLYMVDLTFSKEKSIHDPA